MHSNRSLKILPEIDPSTDLALSVDESAVDTELFIRRAFEENPGLGCELLFRKYYIPLCSHAVRFLGSKDIAEDLVSDIFCQFHSEQIFQSITSSYRAYLYKTVRHRAYNYLRQALKHDTGLDVSSQLYEISDYPQPDDIVQYEELHQDVDAAIQSLPFQRRRIYLMNRFEGKRYAEIAAELGIAVRTVEVQIRQASHHIRDLLRSKYFLLVLIGFSFLYGGKTAVNMNNILIKFNNCYEGLSN